MSYILDALKKSEGERVGDREVPDWKTSHKGDYTPQPSGPTRQQTITIGTLSAILVSLLIGGAYWLFSAKPEMEAASQVAQTAPAIKDNTPASAANKPHQRMTSAQFASSQMAGEGDAGASSAATKSANAANSKATKTTFEKFSEVQNDTHGVSSSKAATVAKKSSSKSATKSTSKSKGKGSVVFAEEPLTQTSVSRTTKKKKPARIKVVSLSELPSNIRRALPAIGFSGHVYSSEDPKQSSVMINGRKMKEGASLTHDLVLEKITESGAQFSFRGHHFYLGALVDYQSNGK